MARDIKTDDDVGNLHDGTNVQKGCLVDGIESKEPGTQKVAVRLYTSTIIRNCGLKRKLKGIQLLEKQRSAE